MPASGLGSRFQESPVSPVCEQAQLIRELFYAHYTIHEITERTGVPIEMVMKVLNSPRVDRVKQSST